MGGALKETLRTDGMDGWKWVSEVVDFSFFLPVLFVCPRSSWQLQQLRQMTSLSLPLLASPDVRRSAGGHEWIISSFYFSREKNCFFGAEPNIMGRRRHSKSSWGPSQGNNTLHLHSLSRLLHPASLRCCCDKERGGRKNKIFSPPLRPHSFPNGCTTNTPFFPPSLPSSFFPLPLLGCARRVARDGK